MGEKIEHHFVPKLLLRPFAENGRQIVLYNIARRECIRGASLRHQCRRRHLYGKGPELEDAFMNLESQVASSLERIRSTGVLPSPSSEKYQSLLFFLGLQTLRTPQAGRALNEMTDKSLKTAYAEDPRMQAAERDGLWFGYEEPVIRNLAMMEWIVYSLSDLQMLIINVDDRLPHLISSDSPAVKYNLYTEGLRGIGSSGLLSRGLMIVLPIGPRTALMLYDDQAYSVVNPTGQMVLIKHGADVQQLNKLQVVNANENLYMTRATDESIIHNLVERSLRFRLPSRVEVEEFPSEDDPEHESLIAMHYLLPNAQLRLSFFHVSRSERAVPMLDRATTRRPMPIEIDGPMPESLRRPRRFIRKSTS